MAKETKIGLVVVALLVFILGGVLIARFRRSSRQQSEVAATTETSPRKHRHQHDHEHKSAKSPTVVVAAGADATTPPHDQHAHPHSATHDHAQQLDDPSWSKYYGAGSTTAGDNSQPSGNGHSYMPHSDQGAYDPNQQSALDPTGAQYGPPSNTLRMSQSGGLQTAEEPPRFRVLATQSGDDHAHGHSHDHAHDQSDQYQAATPRRRQSYTGQDTIPDNDQYDPGGASSRRQYGGSDEVPGETTYHSSNGDTYVYQPTSDSTGRLAVQHPRAGGDQYDSPGNRRTFRTGAAFAKQGAADRHVVKPNETFWTISDAYYGAGSFFKALARYNEDQHPLQDRLDVGDVVLVPSKAELMATYPDLCPKLRGPVAATQAASVSISGGRKYEVEEGDTLFDIAKYQLGDPSRWYEVYQLNHSVLTDDFDYLPPGTVLTLPGRHGAPRRRHRHPSAEQSDRYTRQPGTSPQR